MLLARITRRTVVRVADVLKDASRPSLVSTLIVWIRSAEQWKSSEELLDPIRICSPQSSKRALMLQWKIYHFVDLSYRFLYIVHWKFKLLCGKGCVDPISVGVPIKKGFTFVFRGPKKWVFMESFFFEISVERQWVCDWSHKGDGEIRFVFKFLKLFSIKLLGGDLEISVGGGRFRYKTISFHVNWGDPTEMR